MAVIAFLDVVLGAKTSKFSKGMSNAQRGLERFRAGVRSTIGRMAALAGAYVSLRAVLGSLDLADNLAKTASKLGTTVEGLQKLQQAGELTGVATNTMNMALQRMTRRVAEAAKGTGEAQGAIKELGLDAKRLSALSMEDRVGAIADAMNQVSDPAERLRLAFKLFDSEGVALVNTLKLGSDGLRQIGRDMERTGLITTEQARAAEKAKDAMAEMTRRAKVLGVTIVSRLTPAIIALTSSIQRLLDFMGSMDASTIRAIAQLGAFAAAFGVTTFAVWKLVKAYRAMRTALRGVTIASAIAKAVSSPAGAIAVAAGLAAGVAAAIEINRQFDAIEKSMEKAAKSTNEMKQNMEGIKKIEMDIAKATKAGGPDLTATALERGTAEAFSAARAGGAGNLTRVEVQGELVFQSEQQVRALQQILRALEKADLEVEL